MLRKEQSKRANPSAELYSETWSYYRQGSNNGKQEWSGQGKGMIQNVSIDG